MICGILVTAQVICGDSRRFTIESTPRRLRVITLTVLWGLGTREPHVYIVETSGVYPDSKIQSLNSDPIDLDSLPSQQVL